MTWDAQHRRDRAIRAVTSWADARRDGALPSHLPEVAAAFTDETALVAALAQRWHTRLDGRIERELMDLPVDEESAVVTAWQRAAADLPGIRAILDAAAAAPPRPETSDVIARAQRKDRVLLATLAGRAGITDPDAPAVGREIELRARGAADLVA